MTEEHTWRPMSPDEADVIRQIVSAASISQGDVLMDDLDGAMVSNSTAWILDVRVSSTGAGCDLPDGHFPPALSCLAAPHIGAKSSSGSATGICLDWSMRGSLTTRRQDGRKLTKWKCCHRRTYDPCKSSAALTMQRVRVSRSSRRSSHSRALISMRRRRRVGGQPLSPSGVPAQCLVSMPTPS